MASGISNRRLSAIADPITSAKSVAQIAISAKTQSELSEPSDFARAFARAAIDAGADIFVGHGSHTPLGIELYKGRPIFYSVGNLIMQNETLPFFPAIAYERFGLGHDATPADFQDYT